MDEVFGVLVMFWRGSEMRKVGLLGGFFCGCNFD